MNERQKQEKLLAELDQSRAKIAACKHMFADPIYDPTCVSEGYGMVQDGCGSDPHWSYAGYHDVKKDRWSRECKLCGKMEYSYELETVIIESKRVPKF